MTVGKTMVLPPSHRHKQWGRLCQNDSCFNQAIKWEIMAKNPAANAMIPHVEHAQREIWTAETLFKALELCDDPRLALALNLSFCCSLRMGEMLGLTWDCIDITEENMDQGTASVYVNKELQGVLWCARLDSNQRPSGSEPNALSN